MIAFQIDNSANFCKCNFSNLTFLKKLLYLIMLV